MDKVKCNTIAYRKGFIEVSCEIHEGCINLETWNIDPDVNISAKESFKSVAESAFTGNTELELSLENAENLVKVLQEAIIKIQH